MQQGGDELTKEQKKAVRRALRQYGRGVAMAESWREAVEEGLRRCDAEDPLWGELLRLRYVHHMDEPKVVERLFVCQTTYYRKELEALGVVAVEAARRGLI